MCGFKMDTQADKDGLENILLGKSSSEVITLIHDNHLNEWSLLLETASSQQNNGDGCLLLKVMEIVASKILPSTEEVKTTELENEDNFLLQEKQTKILTMTCSNGRLIESLKSIVVTWSSSPSGKQDELGKFLKQVEQFCSEVLQKLPFLGADLLLNLICSCIGGIASNLELQVVQPNMLVQFTVLQKKVQEINVKLHKDNKPTTKKRHDFSKQQELLYDSLEPPEDFREIPIIPTLEELINETRPFLRPNKVEGAYKSADHYLDVQFRLLREDFVRPLRRGVQDFVKNKNEYIKSSGRRKANQQQDSNVRFYNDITFQGSEQSRDNSQEFLFNLPQRLVSKVKWDKSKRLLPGCLVMLTSDFCKTAIFATTLPSPFDPKQKNAGGGDSRRQDLTKGKLRLSIETGKEFVKEDKSYMMFECESLFEAYRHTLGIMQSMMFLEKTYRNRPSSLHKFVVQGSSDVGRPLYLMNPDLELFIGSSDVFVDEIIDDDYGYDILTDDEEDDKGRRRVVTILNEKFRVDPFRPDQWPSDLIQNYLSVDADQYKALQTALTSEIAVIQGPPGTGKTYVGLQIVKTLLLNKKRDVLPDSPFLVLCYTNHALDQFLELLLEEIPNLGVVRVGGQSKSDEVQQHTLQQHRKRLQQSLRDRGRDFHFDDDGIPYYLNHQKRNEARAFRTLKDIERTLHHVETEIAELSKPNGIFRFEFMGVGSQLQTLLPANLWETLKTSDWLGVRDENFLVPDFRVGEIIQILFVVKPKIAAAVNPTRATVKEVQKKTKTAQPTEVVEDKEEYDMDELMEHRVVDIGDHFDAWSIGKTNINIQYLYLNKCSTGECMRRATDAISNLEYANNEYQSLGNKPHNTRSSISEAIDKILKFQRNIVDFQNRANLFAAIFGLYNEGRLKLPNVDKLFHRSQTEEVDESYEIGNIDVARYPIRLKWGIYFQVVKMALELAKEKRKEVEYRFKAAKRHYDYERDLLDGRIMQNADIIGMTTTGAAKLHNLLEIAKPEIVIVEEAAEILESHIVTSLTGDCKQLILIGDHLQLQPSVNVYELETKFRLNVSMFERMILNGVPLCTLKTQHRMRPEISNLIIGTIYEELHDNENVFQYPPVSGTKKSLFFTSHNEPEETDNDLVSKSNSYEAHFLVGLCQYLLLQGYEHKQITILTTYTGQMFLLKKLLPDVCRGVRITCVDNFQGEENDIILLSLVRSNEEEKVGFVGKDNRICVALSRARHGLFVVGNMSVLASASKTWKKIEKKLKEGGHIGNTLELICERHGKSTLIQNRTDFLPLVNGGCHQICSAVLPCNHTCPQICHAADQTHESYTCRERCTKTCGLNHPCRAKCSKKCPPCCVKVPKVLPCEHVNIIPCYQDPSSVKCRALVMRTLSCELKHELEVECHEDVNEIKCRVLVEKDLPCGHAKMVECDMPLEKVKCEIAEEKTLSCGHKRMLKCYQSMDMVKCDVVVDKVLPCMHRKNLRCHTSVTDKNIRCEVVVDVVVPDCFHVVSGHSLKLQCSSSSNPKCADKCGKKLDCGHDCTLPCHVKKDPNHNEYKCKKKCERSCEARHPCKLIHDCYRKCLPCDKKLNISLECGHSIEVECSKSNGQYKCIMKVKKSLPCGHEQPVSCYITPEMHKCTVQIVDCPKKCALDHPCSFEHACYEGCTPCGVKVEKRLVCGHDAMMRCHDDGKQYKCREIIEKKLPCGHVRRLECSVNFNSLICKETVETKCTKCSVEMSIECCKMSNATCKKCENEAKRKINIISVLTSAQGRKSAGGRRGKR